MAELAVDLEALREQVRDEYREVALQPDATFHFHTGRPLAALLGYDDAIVAAMPDEAVNRSPASGTCSRCVHSAG
jgi:arsenite methyltransferase